MSNPWKDYYEASISHDEWSGVRMENAKKRIDEINEINSWDGGHYGESEEEYNFSGGA